MSQFSSILIAKPKICFRRAVSGSLRSSVWRRSLWARIRWKDFAHKISFGPRPYLTRLMHECPLLYDARFRAKAHIDMAHFVDKPAELFHSMTWAMSMRACSGEGARNHNSISIILPSDAVYYRYNKLTCFCAATTPKYYLGSVLAVDKDYTNTTSSPGITKLISILYTHCLALKRVKRTTPSYRSQQLPSFFYREMKHIMSTRTRSMLSRITVFHLQYFPTLWLLLLPTMPYDHTINSSDVNPLRRHHRTVSLRRAIVGEAWSKRFSLNYRKRGLLLSVPSPKPTKRVRSSLSRRGLVTYSSKAIKRHRQTTPVMSQRTMFERHSVQACQSRLL